MGEFSTEGEDAFVPDWAKREVRQDEKYHRYFIRSYDSRSHDSSARWWLPKKFTAREVLPHG
jgi:hypothetical protein